MSWLYNTLSLFKSVWINLRYLPIRQAIKLPILIYYKSTFEAGFGRIVIDKEVYFGMIRIGFHEVPVCNPYDKTVIRVKGQLLIKGSAHIGRASKIIVGKSGSLILGDDFKISASTAINCYKHIEFGNNIQFSWDCLVMDSDAHTIFDEKGNRINFEKPIIFEDNIWVGCRCTVLKGSYIPTNCVIGAGSVITGQHFSENSIIAGCPPKSLKTIKGWKL